MTYKKSVLAFTLGVLFSGFVYSQPPEGRTANQNEYDQDHIKERSKKSHKKTDKITKHNLKVQEHANKKAEMERKEKLSGKKKENDAHQFPK